MGSAFMFYAASLARLDAMAIAAVYQSGDKQAIARLEARAGAESIRLDRQFKVICIVSGLIAVTIMTFIIGLCTL